MSTPSTPNPRKRGAPAATSSTSSQRQANNLVHDRKRLKIQDARAIAVQSTEAALKGGQLDINSFVKSREFEIRALEDAISNSKHANKKRAFQNVPRSMRRRTASHNVKRVPKRLRARHAKEMADDNTPTVTSRRRKLMPHIRLRVETAKRLQALSQRKAKRDETREKEEPFENALRALPATKTKFRKRQKEKTWLPTHIWHAKRAHMVNRWRYAIAESPTEKSYRPTHRSSTLRGAVAWDHSYYGTILVKGKEKELVGMLQEILGTEDAELAAARGAIRKGRRSWRGWVFEKGGYPTKPISPVLLLWCRPSIKTTSEPEYEKNKGHRSILIRVHPSAFLQLWMTILSVSKAYPSITSEDLRFELGSLEVTGPAATNALLACLQPREKPTSSDTPEGVWENLRSLTNPSSLPPGASLAFSIMDPRISFPPRLPRLSEQEQEESTNKLFSVLSTWPPDRTQSPPALFSREARFASVRAQGSQKRINKRKSEAMPGQLPDPLSTDPYIPIIILANREPSAVPSHKKFSASTSNAIGSWTVILPWKWVLPVWYSLVNFPGVRFGGIVESNQIQYENAVGSFPGDFPGTKAGLEEEGRKAAARKQIWEKRPKQKRTAWESVDLGEGRKGELGQGAWCDWEHLIALVSQGQKQQTATKPTATSPIQPHNPTLTSSGPTAGSMSLDDASIPPAGQIPPPIIPASSITILNSQDTSTHFHSSSSPWTIPTPLIAPLLSSPHIPIQLPLSVLPQDTLAKSLFSVKIIYLHRGSPEPRARIYRLPTRSHAERDPLARKIREGWKDLLDSHEKYEDAKLRYRKKNVLKDINLVRVPAGQEESVSQKWIDAGASRCHRVALLPPLRASLPTPPSKPGNEGYPAVPGEEDLIGFVSSGNFNLKEGRGTGIASLAFLRVFGEWMVDVGAGEQKGAVIRICVVRNVGESVGRLARWELI